MYRVKRVRKNAKPVAETASHSPKRNRLDFLQKEEIIKKNFNLATHREENPNSLLRQTITFCPCHENENEEPEEEDFTVTEPEPVISNSSAITMCDELKKFCIKNNIPIDQEMFSSIKTTATVNKENLFVNAKQSSIKNFFKPYQVQSTSGISTSLI
ncbi:hypothetical protein BpHYR1_037859 [Brachionus plicatilis]|uniref:Uncharacterized protein n=1 Tax=Brachionus plicatilis TaxID=10195 RepID=A0A3M7RRB2_BRAPC|nr:hypothetical protein BpHYR1_037859 [Brachionus plicatilis]